MSKVIKINRLTIDGVPQKQPIEPVAKPQTFKPVTQPRPRNKSRWKKPLMLVLLALILVGGGVLVYTVVIPAQKIISAGQSIRSTANSLAADFERKDLSKIDTYVSSMQADLRIINTEIDKYEFLDDLEATRGYYANLQAIAELTDQTDQILVKALPEFKLLLKSLGYEVSIPSTGVSTSTSISSTSASSSANSSKASSSSSTKSASTTSKATSKSTSSQKANDKSDENIQAVIKELPRMVELYNQLEPDFIKLATTFNKIDPNYIPNVGNDYADKVKGMQKLTQDYPKLSSQIKDLFSTLPTLLGSKKASRYLVILQNEKELRSSSGIVSAYGVVTIKNGEIVGDINFEDPWILLEKLGYYGNMPFVYNTRGQLFWMGRNCGSSQMRPQDIGEDPDLYKTMMAFAQFYDRANQANPREFPGYDHIITFNTYLASDLVRLIEPIKITDEMGRKVTIKGGNLAHNMFRVTSSGGSEAGNRKSFIGQVAEIAQKRFKKLDSDILPGLVGTIVHSIQAKHLGFSSKNAELQKYFDEYDMSGRITKNFNGDYFHLGEAQYCALKSNFYIKNDVVQNISIDKKGKISKSVQVTWRNSTVYNPARHTHILTTATTHLYRAWVRFVVPGGSSFESTDGYEKSQYIYYPKEYIDNNFEKLVSDNAIWYDYRRNTASDPATEYKLNAKYTLPTILNYNKKKEYRMYLEKHPGKEKEKYIINISHNGRKTSKEIILDRDKVLIYKDGAIIVENYDTQLDFIVELVKNAVAL